MPGIITKIKNWIYFILSSSRHYKLSDKKQYAIVNLDHQFANYDMGRFSYMLCRYFQYAGFNIVMKVNWPYFRKISRYKRPLLREGYTLVKTCSTPVNSVVLVIPNKEVKTISLAYGYEIWERNECDCTVPFTLHPNFFKPYPTQETFLTYRASDRKTKILFAGNTDESKYNRGQLKDMFHIISRKQVVDFIKNTYKHDGILTLISDEDALYKMFNPDKELTPIIIAEAKCDNKDWLRMLSTASFFICPPGVYMPLCHNLIEAMSVGTIPILQYADLCVPTLKHMENCLTFSSLNGLQAAMDLALSMDSGEVNRMKNNVILYYQNYLSLENTAETIKKFVASDKSVTSVAVPYIPETTPV